MHRITVPIQSGRLRGLLRRRSRGFQDGPSLTLLRSCPEVSPGVYVGIDPDLSGAIGVLDVNYDPKGKLLTGLQLLDMPCFKVLINHKNRRRVDPVKVLEIVEEVKKSSRNGRLFACLESPSAFSINGGLSTQQTGYMFGLWYGVLLARGFEIETVRPSTWKRQLKLNCKEKDGSRELAKQLFPDSSDYLKRKKDHGRAEALLLAAYGAGFRLLENEDVVPFEDLLLEPVPCTAS